MVQDAKAPGREQGRGLGLSRAGALCLLGLAVACAPSDGVEATGDTAPLEEAVVLLPPAGQLNRISLAVRGVRPTPAELRQVTEDPSLRDVLLEEWLHSEAFGDTVRDLHAEALLVRADTEDILPGVAELEGFDQHQIYTSSSEAALILAEDVVSQDLPYTDVLTADYTWADSILAAAWGLSYDPDGPTWQRTHWVDGRDHAGVLSDSSLWLRHVSNGANYHRGRANFVARTFLCADFDDRDVLAETVVDVADPAAVSEAVRSDASCVSCHQSLDPLAGFFWGLKSDIPRSSILRAYSQECREEYRDMATGEDYCYPLRIFNPEFENDWELHDLRPPGFYGHRGSGLGGLGASIIDDPRFASCTVRRFAGYLSQTPLDEVPDRHVAQLQDRFVQSGFSAIELVRDIVTDDRFLADHATSDAYDEDVTGPQILRPEQLARTLEATTGFRWRVAPDGPGCIDTETECWGEDDLLTSDNYGFRAMSGGIDSVRVIRPTHTPTPSKQLVLEKVAGEAAAYVVEHDLTRPVSQRHLLKGVEADTTEEVAIRAQLVELTAALHGRLLTADDPEIDALWALWSGFPIDRSWDLVIWAMLRDPGMVLY